MKIGIVNVQQVLDESAAGKVQGRLIKTVTEKWQKRLKEVEARLNSSRIAQQELEASNIAADVARARRETKMLEIETHSLKEQARVDIEVQRDMSRQTVLRQAQEHLQRLAEEQQLDLVITIPSPYVAYFAQALDLTADLVRRLDSDTAAHQLR